MSVIRAEQVAAEEAAEAEAAGESTRTASVEAEQYVFTITDGGFAKRTRISDYRLQSRGGIGIKAMSLANEDRGGLVGAFIVGRGRRGPLDHPGRPGRAQPDRRPLPADRPLHHGREVRDAQGRRRGRGGGPLGRGQGRRGVEEAAAERGRGPEARRTGAEASEAGDAGVNRRMRVGCNNRR